MYCTIVSFRASYENGVTIDGLVSAPWLVQTNIQALMDMLDTREDKQRLFESMPPDELKAAEELCHAFSSMTLRATLNNDMRGPYVFHTEDPLTEQFLLDWAESNVFNQRKEKRYAQR